MIVLVAAILGNLPLVCAVVGHIRAHRIQDEFDAGEWAGILHTSWHQPTPPTPLRAVDWPQRQTPTDLQTPYEPTPLRNIPPPDWDEVLREARAWNWAVEQLRLIVAVSDEYDELVAA